MIRIAVFGSTGRTGSELIRSAIQKEISLIAFARNAQKLSELADTIRIVEGELHDTKCVGEALERVDAAVICFGPRRPYSDFFCADATATIIGEMTKRGINRLICVTGAMIGEGYRNRGLFYRLMRRMIIMKFPELIKDRDEQEKIVKDSSLAWTILKPPRIVDGAETARIETGPGIKVGILSTVTAGSLASVIIREVTEPQFIRDAVFITS